MTERDLGRACAALKGPTVLVNCAGGDDPYVAAWGETVQAQLVHVVVSTFDISTYTANLPVRLLVDLCVYVSLPKFRPLICGAQEYGPIFARDIPQPAPRRSHVPSGFWLHEEQARGHAQCTAINMGCVPHFDNPPVPSVGEAVKLRVLLEMRDILAAHHMAELLCERFERWTERETKLVDTIEAIRRVLVEPAEHATKCYAIYRAASAGIEWTQRIRDPEFVLSGTVDTQSATLSPGLRIEGLNDFCAEHVQEAWFGAISASEFASSPSAVGHGELTMDGEGDVADDFVCADRLMTLWFGNRRRHRRESFRDLHSSEAPTEDFLASLF